jgi:hypothetical protein
VYRFPDDSAGRTVAAGAGPTVASFPGACLNGGDGPDQLVGHGRGGILRGGAGDDRLTARGGITLLDGGPGKDRFEANGFTIVRLPAEDVAPGETVVCNGRDPVQVISPLDRAGLERAGVVFESCRQTAACVPHEVDVASSAEDEDDCHGPRDTIVFGRDSGEAAFHLLMKAIPLKLVPFYDGPGVGTCTTNDDCAALGLEFCLPSGGKSQCYPTPAIADWCDDPYFARNVADEATSSLVATGEKFVLPIVLWLPRSDAIPPTGACGSPASGAAATIKDWHRSIAGAMSAVVATFGAWGVAVDYRIREFQVDAGSGLVNPTDPTCTNVVYSKDSPLGDYDPSHPNAVEDLIAAHPTRYLEGRINVYLTDQGSPHGESSSYLYKQGNTEKWRPFILLHGGVGAIVHELSHMLGLGHPFDGNLFRSGAASEVGESRNSWNYRPFPDQPTNGVHLCVFDSECEAIDAPPGLCVHETGNASGYCLNLKIDCATNGDRTCDTPWDAPPCFDIASRLGLICETDADCHANGGWLGTAYLTDCAPGKQCVPRSCTANANCPSGMCVGGKCANEFFTHSETCCDLHDDTDPDHNHDRCIERAGPELSSGIKDVPGIGNATTWPLARNALTYHRPGGAVPGTFTRGQHDKVVCRLNYEQRWGTLRRKGNADGGPCSLVPGATAGYYTNVGVNESRVVAHGACASGACAVGTSGPTTTATCVAAACNDGAAEPAESDVDCGGVCRTQASQLCTFHPDANPANRKSQACASGADCTSGLCTGRRCQPTCTDADRGGEELGVDAGGSGREPTCPARSLGATCRFGTDCTGGAPSLFYCNGARDCVTAADCPINDDARMRGGAACVTDADCPGGKCRPSLASYCATATCTKDADCTSGACNEAIGRCRCDEESDCPGTDTCGIQQGMCVSECIDGRCLGHCAIFTGL